MKRLPEIGPLKNTRFVEKLDDSEYRSKCYFHPDSEDFYKFLGSTKNDEIVWNDTLRELCISDNIYNSLLDNVEGLYVDEEKVVTEDSEATRKLHGFEIDPREKEIYFVLGISDEQEFGRPVIALFCKMNQDF